SRLTKSRFTLNWPATRPQKSSSRASVSGATPRGAASGSLSSPFPAAPARPAGRVLAVAASAMLASARRRLTSIALGLLNVAVFWPAKDRSERRAGQTARTLRSRAQRYGPRRPYGMNQKYCLQRLATAVGRTGDNGSKIAQPRSED